MCLYDQHHVSDASHPMAQQVKQRMSSSQGHHAGPQRPIGVPLVATTVASVTPQASDESFDYMPQLSEPSDILTPHQVKELASSLPISFQFSNWRLVYSLVKHGISINTFFRSTADKGPSIIVIRDHQVSDLVRRASLHADALENST